MKVKYSNNSTRWEVIIFNYLEDIPLSTDTTAEVVSGNRGVVGIGISRSKSSIQNAATIQIIGDLDPAYTIGNWVIIKSKVGKFTEKDQEFQAISPLSEGSIRFIGQITTIENDYSIISTGMLSKRATIHIREWSSVLNIPIKIDAYALSDYYNQNSTAGGRIGVLGDALKNNNIEINIKELAEDLVNPFTSASLVLAIIGGLNIDKETGVDLESSLGKYSGLINLSRLISRMPKLPKEILKYLKLPDSVTADQPFSTGFINTLVGVMKPESSWTSPLAPVAQQKANAMNGYGQKPKDLGAFSGYFSNYNSLKFLFKNYEDRPLTTNFLASLAKGVPAWDLVQGQLDTTTNEAFTDIWYFKDEKGVVNSLPMIILRDKPFALKAFLENTESPIKNTKWTAFDDVPRVFVDNVCIQSVSTVNSFFNSPNYIEPNFQSGDVGSVRGDSSEAVYTKAVHRIIDTPAIDKFGTIAHYWNTVYSAPTKIEGDQIIYVDWFDDVKKIMYYWHTINYRFGEARLTLKDNNLPIMVGCNISFELGDNVLCGHVESVSWGFNIQMDGTASTITNVQLSHLCKVQEGNGQLIPIGPTGFTNLTDKELISEYTKEILDFPDSSVEPPKEQETSARFKIPRSPFE